MPLTSMAHVITIYIDDSSGSSCKCDLVLQKLDQVLEAVELISSEMGVTTSDVYDIKQRCKAMENQLFSMVCWRTSTLYNVYTIYVHVYIHNHLYTTLQRSRPLPPLTPRVVQPPHSAPFMEPRPLFSPRASSFTHDGQDQAAIYPTTPATLASIHQDIATVCSSAPATATTSNTKPLQDPPASDHEETATIPAIATTRNLQPSQDQPASDHEETAYDTIPATATISNLQPSASSTPTTVSTTGQSTAIGLPSSARLSELRRLSCSRRTFAKKISVETYTREELYTSNVNGKLGKKQLDPVRMEKITETVFLSYPLEHGEKMEKALKDCRHAIDEHGRELHRQEK